MALSGTIAEIYTAQQVVDSALRRIGYIGAGETSSGDDYADSQAILNQMLKSWSMTGPNLWTRAEATITLASGTQEYTLSPRPRRVKNMRFAIDGTERLPLTPFSRDDWDRFILKASTGSPLKYVLDYQRASVSVKFWPVPTFSGATWTVPYSYERIWEDVTAPAQDIDVPQEWFETVILNLAVRCHAEFQMPETPAIAETRQLAGALFNAAMTFDRDGDVRIDVVLR